MYKYIVLNTYVSNCAWNQSLLWFEISFLMTQIQQRNKIPICVAQRRRKEAPCKSIMQCDGSCHCCVQPRSLVTCELPFPCSLIWSTVHDIFIIVLLQSFFLNLTCKKRVKSFIQRKQHQSIPKSQSKLQLLLIVITLWVVMWTVYKG